LEAEPCNKERIADQIVVVPKAVNKTKSRLRTTIVAEVPEGGKARVVEKAGGMGVVAEKAGAVAVMVVDAVRRASVLP